jgi:hypothetical protein
MSESELLYDWRFTANQFVLATSPLRITTRNVLQVDHCGHSPYVNILSDERMDLSLMNRFGLCHVYVSQRVYMLQYIHCSSVEQFSPTYEICEMRYAVIPNCKKFHIYCADIKIMWKPT